MHNPVDGRPSSEDCGDHHQAHFRIRYSTRHASRSRDRERPLTASRRTPSKCRFARHHHGYEWPEPFRQQELDREPYPRSNIFEDDGIGKSACAEHCLNLRCEARDRYGRRLSENTSRAMPASCRTRLEPSYRRKRISSFRPEKSTISKPDSGSKRDYRSIRFCSRSIFDYHCVWWPIQLGRFTSEGETLQYGENYNEKNLAL